MNKIIRWFFNKLYKIRPPESVRYYKTAQAARARLTNAEDGSLQMEIQGEKYPFAGFPRGHILSNSLSKIKNAIKERIFNQVFGEIEKMSKEHEMDMLPPEKCCPAVREMHRVFDQMEHMEVSEDMRGRIRLIKKVLTFFLQEDDAYRFRAQHFLSEIDQKKVALSKADKYYARAKYWKPDYKHYDY